MSDNIEFKISADLVKPILEAKIQAAIIDAMGGQEKFLHDIVNNYLTQKVDKNGNISSYNSDNKYTRAEAVLMKVIQESLEEELKKYLAENTPTIRKAFMDFFRSKKGTNAVVTAMEKGLCESLSKTWFIKTEVNLVSQER